MKKRNITVYLVKMLERRSVDLLVRFCHRHHHHHHHHIFLFPTLLPPPTFFTLILRTSKPSFASHPAPHPGVDVQGVRPSKPTVRDNPGSGVRTLYPPVLCVTFLKKLSIYRENKDKMLECNIIDKLARWGLCKWNAVDP
jgi:hypothetical protein